MEHPKLEILIPTLKSRSGLLSRLLNILKPQLTPEVRILTDCDDGQVSIGEKRNRLLSHATADYVCFVDDDDTVSEDYVASLLDGIARDVDVVCIRGIFTTNGEDPAPFYDKVHQVHGLRRLAGQVEYTRGIQHLDAIRRTIAVSQKFPDSSFGEDYEWGVAIERSGMVQSSWEVDHPIYFYDYRWPKDRDQEPSFAVVVPCLNHVYTTHKSIESLLENTSDPNFVLVLVDDGSTDDTADYAHDLTMRLGSRRFHYHRNPSNLGVNESWNIGIGIAKSRGAKKLAICNNDLLYSPGWDVSLKNSLDDHEVGIVSPLSTFGPIPWDWPHGNERSVNPAGYVGYMPILGCCFALTTDTWDKIGPFPSAEGLKIYFGDNWIAAAAQAHGLACGYDDESYVHHLFCITTAKLDNGPIWKREGPIFDRLMAERGWTLKPYVEAVAEDPQWAWREQ